MNVKYILALFLTAAFFMSGCSSMRGTSSTEDGVGIYENTGTDYYGTASYGTTGDGLTGNGLTGDGIANNGGTLYNGRTDSNIIYGGRNTTANNDGMASSTTTRSNY
ncbi:hypothetical protein SDC9_85197 [bioreactor metagenome]|uniref:Uncharacterized protein n=1 Tax=bioreactor metagenome TaxID=1076179 RepID=A0A644ZE31_9ZZZZ|nr:hypothetical protein [Candidatus Metalachnospira sp.]